MENWLKRMNFSPLENDLENVVHEIKKNCQPYMKLVWHHIVTHVIPSEEAKLIRKQCLLYKLRSSGSNDRFEGALESIHDYNDCLRIRKSNKQLQDILQRNEVLKRSIKEKSSRMESQRESSLNQEQVLKESTWRLSHLKKKTRTVEKSIHSLTCNAKILNLLCTSPERLVSFGRFITDKERKLLILQKEQGGIDANSLLVKMKELCKSSEQLHFMFCFKNMTEMKHLFLLHFKKLKSIKNEYETSKLKLIEENQKLVDLCKHRFKENNEEIENLGDYIQKEAELSGRDYCDVTKNYAHEVYRMELYTLGRIIRDKVYGLNALHAEDEEGLEAKMPSEKFKCDHSLPESLPIEKLENSVINEISLFMALPNCYAEENMKVNKATTHFEVIHLNNEMVAFSKLIALEKEINSLAFPFYDTESQAASVHLRIDSLFSCYHEKVKHLDSLTGTLDSLCKRLKSAYVFWKKVPLNEKLTGVEINGQDISFWLNKYMKTKKLLETELEMLEIMKY